MKRVILHITLLLLAVANLSSCKSKSNDKEIVNFLTEGLTQYQREPFGTSSTHSAILLMSDQYKDWEVVLRAINLMMIRKETTYGEKVILTSGNPHTELVVHRVLLNDKYKNDIQTIYNDVIKEVSQKTGINIQPMDDFYGGRNEYIGVTIKKNLIIDNKLENNIDVRVDNFQTDNSIWR